MSMSATIKPIQDIMRKDVDGPAQVVNRFQADITRPHGPDVTMLKPFQSTREA